MIIVQTSLVMGQVFTNAYARTDRDWMGDPVDVHTVHLGSATWSPASALGAAELVDQYRRVLVRRQRQVHEHPYGWHGLL